MNIIKGILQELFSLFIDDVAFSAAVVAWVVIAGVGMKAAVPLVYAGAVFAAGLYLLLIFGTVRRAKVLVAKRGKG